MPGNTWWLLLFGFLFSACRFRRDQRKLFAVRHAQRFRVFYFCALLFSAWRVRNDTRSGLAFFC